MKVHVRVLLGIGLAAGLFGSAVFIRTRGAGAPEPLPRHERVASRASSTPPATTPARRAIALSGPAALAPSKDAVQEREGAYGYRSSTYGATADRDRVTVALPRGSEKVGRGTLSLSLDEIRLGGSVIARGGPSAPELDKARQAALYARGPVEERYIFRKEALEQEFVIRELPPEAGDLVISTLVRTKFSAPQEGTRSKELTFAGPGGSSFKISEALALDAAGRKLPLDLAYADGRIGMTVPASWVAEATLPITVDPLVGGSFVLDPQLTFVTERLGVAYCPVTNEWMAIWSNGFGATSEDIYGARVSAAGALVGVPFLISSSSNVEDIRPSIAYSAAANRFLAVWWNRDQTTNTHRLQGRFVNPDGAMPAASFTLLGPSSLGFDQTSVAADGGGGFYAISRSPTTSSVPILGCLVSPSGAVTPGIDPSPVAGGNWPRVAYANNEYMVVWEDNNGIAVRRLSASGTFLTPITYIQAQEGANANDIAGAGDRFLVTWTASALNCLKGRVILADGAASINYGASETVIYSPVAYYPASAYSAASGEWYTVHASGAGLQDLRGSTVSSTGAVSSGAELVATPISIYQPGVAWNSATNEMLVVYQSVAVDPPQLMAQRVAMSGSSVVRGGRWKFDEGTGTVAHDSSGAGNDGALIGGVTWTAGKSGSAFP